VTQQDVERWRAAAEAGDPMRQLVAVTAGDRTPPVPAPEPEPETEAEAEAESAGA